MEVMNKVGRLCGQVGAHLDELGIIGIFGRGDLETLPSSGIIAAPGNLLRTHDGHLDLLHLCQHLLELVLTLRRL